MKRISFLALLSAAVIVSSCSKDADEKIPTGENSPAKVSIKVSSPTRAITDTDDFGSDTDASYDKVNNFSVFISDKSGEIKWKSHSDDGSEISGIEVTTDANHVYVVANAGNLTSSINSMSQLEQYTISLATASQNQTSARWATGVTSTPLSFVQVSEDEFEASTTVELTFVAARISLKIVDNMSGKYSATNPDNLLELKNVVVLNARSQSKLFGSSLVVNPAKYFSGMADPGFANVPDPQDVTESALMTDAIPAYDFDKTYYYYVFENDAVNAEDFPTIAMISAEFNGENGITEVYYPVHLAPYEQLTGSAVGPNGLLRGKSYNITITLSVDPETDPGGTIDPTIPLVSAEVDVDIQLKDWVPVTLNKEFS